MIDFIYRFLPEIKMFVGFWALTYLFCFLLLVDDIDVKEKRKLLEAQFIRAPIAATYLAIPMWMIWWGFFT